MSKRYRRKKSSRETCLKSPQKGFFLSKCSLSGVEKFSRSGVYIIMFVFFPQFQNSHIKNSINDKIYCGNVASKLRSILKRKFHTKARSVCTHLYNKIFGPSKTSHKSWREVRTLLTQLHFEISHYAKVKTSIF